MSDELSWVPAHKAGMTIDHNPHHGNYETVAQHLEYQDYAADEFVSPAEMQRAIDTGELWVIHWYPDTPVGSCQRMASSLEALRESFIIRPADKEGA